MKTFKEIGKDWDAKIKARKARKSNKQLTLDLIRKEMEAADHPGCRAQLLEMERRVKHPVLTKIDSSSMTNLIGGTIFTLALTHADEGLAMGKNVVNAVTDLAQGKFSKKQNS